ncbi:amino acid racemase [Clostridium sp. WLY-B-L2]|jgi:aspartate racemase|uniref:Amino acid racemase n=1 Tax=Clostridium aromativorans TaxID=2836848 RepID=A0ABS8N6H9_9CLOT|nr:amino acid racemase [Clostridium aromativorans]MCC9295291.1 amino acid racemase [Clostridium aromativorans]CAB1261772.1 Aspartate racemase [Clostridiaceae bacterium BL-3]
MIDSEAENINNTSKKIIGILGGMGPLATADLFYKIITLTDAKSDNEHIHVIIDNNTEIPDRTNYILGTGEDPKKYLIESALKLELMGADVIIMPCNTAHYFYDEIVKYIHIPFLNMISETVKEIRRTNTEIKKVGLLATKGTCFAGIYDKIFNKYNIEVVKPDDTNENIVSDLIYSVKKGVKKYDLNSVQSVLSYFKSKDVDTVILGCTELPVAFKMLNIKGNYVDPTKILAQSAIKFVGKKIVEHE